MYRKYTADKIFDGNSYLAPGQVLVTCTDGVIEDIISLADAGDDLETFEGTLCPGFINAHCHIELSHLKGMIPPGTGLVNFVQGVLKYRSLEASSEAMELAAGELNRNGTVAIGDICNTPVSIELKTNSNIFWKNFIEVSGFVPSAAPMRMAEMEQVLHQFQQNELNASISPHAPYSVSHALFNLINSRTPGHTISIHNQEAAAENELYSSKSGAFLELYQNLGISIDSFAGTGKSSLQNWMPHFTKQQKVIAVHNTFSSDADLDFMKRHITIKGAAGQGSSISNLYLCICINANLFIENKLPPVERLLHSGIPIVLGTDSYASNWQLSIMEEINTLQKHFPSIPLEVFLKWSTKNGAQALGIDQRFGSFEKGKKPGIVNIINGKASLVTH